MKKEEIEKSINFRFKKMDKHFHNAIKNFEGEAIREFRNEIRELKVFLNLISMESEDDLLYHISHRMKIFYGYLGIIQNFNLQLKEAIECHAESSKHVPVFYVNILEKELEYWKSLSKDFIETAYDFSLDENEIIASLSRGLPRKSITNFINYRLYEIGEMSAQHHEELNKVAKLMEDIYYNLPLLKPYLTEEQSILFDEKEVKQCLNLFRNYQGRGTALGLLQTFSINALDKKEKLFIKQMRNDWVCEKKEIKVQLAAKIDAMYIHAGNLNKLSLHE